MQHAEQQRLDADARRAENWKRWGPYLAERQWGTVREDYSEYGNCWDYFSHDHARSRAGSAFPVLTVVTSVGAISVTERLAVVARVSPELNV